MPSPPPRLISSTVVGASRATSAARSTTIAAATANDSSTRICEPMWQWKPAKCKGVGLRHPQCRFTRRAVGDGEAELRVVGAGGDVLVRVRLDPGRDPHQHAAARPPRPASASSRSSSSNESATMRPTPRSRAARSSSSDLLLPWNTTRPGGNPARTATCSSPPVATSRWRPSSATRRAIASAQERLAHVRDGVGAERGAVLAGSAPGARLRRTRRAVCRRWARARRRRSRRSGDGRRCRRWRPGGRDAGRSARRARCPRRHHSASSSSSSSRDISSGACTPRMASASARPIRQASPSQRRACVVASSSEITRQSR